MAAISSPDDFRAAAKRRLPRFLFDYADGGAFAERTLRDNVSDLAGLSLRQRVLRDVASVDTATRLFGRSLPMPVVLAPIGMGGMYRRRGEAQAARAANARGLPFTVSTVSLCSIAEVAERAPGPLWFQLYVLRDRGFMRALLDGARRAGAEALVFTVDMPVPAARYRDGRSGLSGRHARLRRMLQAIGRPRWAWDVGVHGRPHRLGNLDAVLGGESGMDDYMGWLGANFDPSIQWRDLEWIRAEWNGPLIIKGIMEAEDARAAVKLGADGIVVSNHGGRQLDGAPSTARALPAIADAVAGDAALLADSGVRSGLDVLRMLALGADAVMIGRAWLWALAARGEAGVTQLLDMFERELRVGMTLTGVNRIAAIDRSILVEPAAQAGAPPRMLEGLTA